MSSLRPGPAAIVLGVATWAQLCLAPAAARTPLDPLSLAVSLAPLAALGAAAALAPRAPERASALGLAAFPCLIGLSAFVSGRDVVPRFDVPSRVLAAATARPTSNVLIGLHQALGDAPALDLPTRGDRPREVDLG
jgi:hypothetical protein